MKSLANVVPNVSANPIRKRNINKFQTCTQMMHYISEIGYMSFIYSRDIQTCPRKVCYICANGKIITHYHTLALTT